MEDTVFSSPEIRAEVQILRTNFINLLYGLQNTKDELTYLRKEREKTRIKMRKTAGSIIRQRLTDFFQHSAILCFVITLILQLNSLIITYWLPELFLEESDHVMEINPHKHVTWLELLKHGDIFNLIFWQKHSDFQ